MWTYYTIDWEIILPLSSNSLSLLVLTTVARKRLSELSLSSIRQLNISKITRAVQLLAVVWLWWWCSIKVFHTKFNQNRIINEDFKILGEEGTANLWELSIFSLSSTKIHTKCNQNKIIKEDFKILGERGGSHFQLKLN